MVNILYILPKCKQIQLYLLGFYDIVEKKEVGLCTL